MAPVKSADISSEKHEKATFAKIAIITLQTVTESIYRHMR